MNMNTKILVALFLSAVTALATDITPNPSNPGNLGSATGAFPDIYGTNLHAVAGITGATVTATGFFEGSGAHLSGLPASGVPLNGTNVWTGSNNFTGTLQKSGVNVLTNLGTAPDAATFNAATATTASGLSGVLTIANLPPFVLTNFWAGTFTNLGNYVGVGTFTNTGNAGFGGTLTVSGASIVGGFTFGTGSNPLLGAVSGSPSMTGGYPIIGKLGGAASGDFPYWSASGISYLSDSGINRTNPAFAGYVSATNGFGVLATNVAPTSVTLGVTAPDFWNSYTNTAGQKVFTPGWLNH